MIKSFIAAAAAAPLFAGAAMAGPYVNVEANSGFTGSNYTGTATDLHVGYEGPIGDAATENLGLYGEVSFVGSGSSSVDRGYGTKVGVKYSF